MGEGFIVLVVLAAITAFGVASNDAQFQHPKEDRSRFPPKRYPNAERLKLTAYVVVAASVGALVELVNFGLIFVEASLPAMFSFTLLIVTVALVPIYVLLASTLRCPCCSQHILLQHTTHPKHAKNLNGWLSTAYRAALRQPFQCMYCGQKYVLKI